MWVPSVAELWEPVGAGPWLWEGGPERERERGWLVMVMGWSETGLLYNGDDKREIGI